MKWEQDDAEIMGPGWEEIRQERRAERQQWRRRAAQWAALDLAREVFGRTVDARLAAYPARGGIEGLLTLEVPFRTLADHERREGVFLSLASRDPVLRQVALLFVFEPRFAAPTGAGS